MKKALILFAVLAIAALLGSNATATLLERNTWVGSYGISSDGWGGTDNSGAISADVPVGATVEAAYLYSAAYFTNSFAGISFNGSPVAPALIGNTGNFLWSGFTDVTSSVKPTIDVGGGGLYNFNMTDANNINGNALVVVYSLPSLPTATVAIMDGAQSFAGDTFNLNFADPLDPSDPGFFAEMTLGIQHSCCNQRSTVRVNGSILTNNAGNFDDGERQANGSLITVGGIGDDLLNTNTYAGDDERYDLTPFVTLGDTSISVFTVNPSNDDQIFLSTFYLSGVAAVNEPPPDTDLPPVPEPSTILLLGVGLIGGAFARRKIRK